MAVYDPKKDTWTMVAPPFGPDWDFIGDSPWTMLANGHLLLGNKLNKHMAELDPDDPDLDRGLQLRQG